MHYRQLYLYLKVSKWKVRRTRKEGGGGEGERAEPPPSPHIPQVAHSHLWLNQIKMYVQNVHLSKAMFYNSKEKTEQLN